MGKGLLGAAAIALVLAVVCVIPPRTAHAWDWGTVTYEGVVTRIDGTPVANLMVEATDCLDGPADFTDANGRYHIVGNAHLCFRDPMTMSTMMQYSPDLTAQDKNTLIDSSAMTTGAFGEVKIANIKMGLRTFPVPEYGWLGSIIAAGGAIGAMAYIRRGGGAKSTPFIR